MLNLLIDNSEIFRGVYGIQSPASKEDVVAQVVRGVRLISDIQMFPPFSESELSGRLADLERKIRSNPEWGNAVFSLRIESHHRERQFFVFHIYWWFDDDSMLFSVTADTVSRGHLAKHREIHLPDFPALECLLIGLALKIPPANLLRRLKPFDVKMRSKLPEWLSNLPLLIGVLERRDYLVILHLPSETEPGKLSNMSRVRARLLVVICEERASIGFEAYLSPNVVKTTEDLVEKALAVSDEEKKKLRLILEGKADREDVIELLMLKLTSNLT